MPMYLYLNTEYKKAPRLSFIIKSRRGGVGGGGVVGYKLESGKKGKRLALYYMYFYIFLERGL